MIRVSGRFTRILQLWMADNGIDEENLHARLELVSRKDTVSVDEWSGLLRLAAELRPGERIGLQIGSKVQIEHVGVLGYLVLNSESVADALETYLLCERHFYSVNFAELAREDSGWVLAWPDQLGNRNALSVEVGITALVTFLRQRFPGGCHLQSVALTGDEPGDITLYEQFFGCPVLFGRTYPGITFDSLNIHRCRHGALPEDFHSMRSQQQSAFSSVAGGEDPFLRRMQSVLLKVIPEGGATLPQVAAALNCSPRTLQRRLAGYDLSFQALLDGVREQLALRYLSRTSLTLSEIPLLLGYSDQSAFNRAYKSWTGITPGRFRKQVR